MRFYTEHKGFEISIFADGFTVFYQGDEIYFDTEKEAQEFIDSVEEG